MIISLEPNVEFNSNPAVSLSFVCLSKRLSIWIVEEPSGGPFFYKILLTLTRTAQLTPNQNCYNLSKPEIEFNVMKEMYAALSMRTCSEKTTF